MFGEQRRLAVMEGELLGYWKASSIARALAGNIGRQSADFTDALDDLDTIQVMTDWETLRTAAARSLSNIPRPRKPQLAVTG